MSTYELMVSNFSNNNFKVVIDICMSSNGQYLILINFTSILNGYIYYSKNYGIDWDLSYVNGSQTPFQWYAIAMNLDGSICFACMANGNIYKSDDYGVNWNITNAPSTYWTSIATSSSGEFVTACSSGNFNIGLIYTSSDYGVNWNTTTAPQVSWFYITMSSSGQYIAANNTVGGSTGIYISKDFGNNWNLSLSLSPSELSIAISSSGQYISACNNTSSNNIYISNNFGDNWTTLSENENFIQISMSSSGQYITIMSNNDTLYFSNNYGNNFNILSNAVILEGIELFAINSSGQKISISTITNLSSTPYSSIIYNYNLYNTNITPVITPYFGILQNYHFSLNTSNYINIIDPRTLGVGGTGNIYIFNVTSGYSTYLLFRSIYNSTNITQNQIYILNDPTLFHDTNIAIYFSYIYGTVTITNNINCNFIVTVEGSFNYNLPENIIENAGSVPGTSVEIKFQ